MAGDSFVEGIGIIIGAFVGFIIAFLFMLLTSGIFAIFLQLCQNVEKLEKKMKS